MDQPSTAFVSTDGRYRATSRRRSDGTFVVELWKYSPTEQAWTPLGSPSITADTHGAERVALSRLEDVSGTPIDLAPDPPTIDWIRSYSGDASAEFIPVQTVRAVTNSEELLRVDLVVRVAGHYLLREVDPPREWWMGSESDGVIRSWGTYGPSLSRAIDSL